MGNNRARSRAIRAEMEASGVSYSAAAQRVDAAARDRRAAAGPVLEAGPALAAATAAAAAVPVVFIAP